MKFSVVTPSFNQAKYLEETIDSVLSQNVRDLQYIIMDGGSTDGSVEIIKKYERHLHYWQSAPDGGQTQALAEGFKRSDGDILSWINSDDKYEPGSLRKVEQIFESDQSVELLYGDYSILFPDGRKVPKPKISFDFEICLYFFLMIPQPSSFWRRSTYNAVGGLNTHFQYAFDYDFFLRVGDKLRETPAAIRHVHDLYSIFRVHDESKSVAFMTKFKNEEKQIREQFNRPKIKAIRKMVKAFHMGRTLTKYYYERGFIPLRSEQGKA